MEDNDPFFIVRKGQVWACWLSGRAPVSLGEAEDVRDAMAQFLSDNPGSEPDNPAPQPADTTPRQVPSPATGFSGVPEAKRGTPVERAAPRHDLTIVGKVFTGTGSWEVTVLDLSETGCRISDPKWSLKEGAPISIRIGPIGPVDASVRWRKEQQVGIRFGNPLYPSVLEHIRQHFDLRK